MKRRRIILLLILIIIVVGAIIGGFTIYRINKEIEVSENNIKVLKANNNITSINNYVSKYYGVWVPEKEIGSVPALPLIRFFTTLPSELIISPNSFETFFKQNSDLTIHVAKNPSYGVASFTSKDLLGVDNFKGLFSNNINEIFPFGNSFNSYALDQLETNGVFIENNKLYVVLTNSSNYTRSIYLCKKIKEPLVFNNISKKTIINAYTNTIELPNSDYAKNDNDYASKYYGTWVLNKKIGTAQSASHDGSGSVPPTKIVISNKIFEREFNGQIGRYIPNPIYYTIQYTPKKLFGTNNFTGIQSKEITEIFASPLKIKPNTLSYLGLDNTRSVLISDNTLFVITSKDGIQSFYSYTKES